MKVLLLGVGMQGKAALHDLVHSEEVAKVVVADRDFEALEAHVESKPYGDKVQCEYADAASAEHMNNLMEQGADVAIDLLPPSFHDNVVAAAVRHGIHLVNASYTTPKMKRLAGEAKAKDITILPEFGMDPGIDLVLLGEAVRSLDHIEEITTYGAGFLSLRQQIIPSNTK